MRKGFISWGWSLAGMLLFSSQVTAAPAGTYMLDKKVLGQKLEARFAKLPDNRKAFVGMAKSMFESMEMTLVLTQDGKAKTHAAMKVMGHLQAYRGNGTWAQQGNTVTISTQVTAKKRQPFAQTLACDINATGMSCYDPKNKQHALPFVRHLSQPVAAPVVRRPTEARPTVTSTVPAQRTPMAPAPATPR